MISERELDDMLTRWSKEYGPGGMPREADTNWLQTIIDGGARSTKGRHVVLNTIADEVENAVKQMENMPGEPGRPCMCFRAAKVLRVNYLQPDFLPEQERLYKLSRIGLSMGRDTYYRALGFGRAFLMGRLECRKVAA